MVIRRVALGIVGCLLAVILTAASCGKAPAVSPTTTSPTTQTATTPSSTTPSTASTQLPTTTAKDVPTYGGMVNFIQGGEYLARWDPTAGSHEPLTLIYEHLLYYDWYKSMKDWGSEYAYGPQSVLTGWLAESWEMPDASTFRFHIRQGVHWQNKAPANGRELVADDIKYSLEWYTSSPLVSVGADWKLIDSITTGPDKYTITFHTKTPQTPEFIYNFMGSGGGVLTFCPDPIKVYGPKAYQDWKLACGTGPFMVTDYVAGSSATYKRNPDYWEFDKNYPENRLPYVSTVRCLVIPDTATRLTALRTGKLTWVMGVTWSQAETFRKTNPELKYRRVLGMPGLCAMNVKQLPFTDVRVRQAMNMAIDYKAIIDGYYKGNAEIAYLTWPLHRSLGEMALTYDELSQTIKDQFEYHPDKARELLAAAGYPGGFKTSVDLVATDLAAVDIFSVVQSDLAAINVKLELKIDEAGAFASLKYGHTYTQMLVPTSGGPTWQGGPRADLSTWYTPGIYDYPDYSEQAYLDRLAAAKMIMNDADRTKAYKELAKYVLEQALYVLIPAPYNYTYWQPWVKGYSGQYGMFYSDYNMFKHWWVDPSHQE